MAEDLGQIREAIEQTRADIGETVQAIAQKADVKGAIKKAAAGRDQLKSKSTEGQDMLTDLGHRLEQKVPDTARQLLTGSAGRIEEGASAATSVWKRQRRLFWLAAVMIGLLGAMRIARRSGH
jgi:Protein of unknown function (DUF3618)